MRSYKWTTYTVLDGEEIELLNESEHEFVDKFECIREVLSNTPIPAIGRFNATIIEEKLAKKDIPVFPFYETVVDRLKSYDEYPLYHYPRPKQLARAGLFYTGDNDKVRCFHCGEQFRNWSGESPMKRHSREFPDCEYVRLHSEMIVEEHDGQDDVFI